MPRPRPPYLLRETTRHGAVVWYVRRGDGPRIRIRGDYGSPEFIAAYEAAVAGNAAPEKDREAPESLAWLVARYRDSSAWARLSSATKRQRENIFRHVLASAGDFPFARIDRAAIVAGRERRKDRPSAANNWLNAMRQLYQWALDANLVAADPTQGVAGVARPRTGGFHQWTEEEIEAFEATWPVGTRERLALAILLYTGLRRGDAARLGRQHIKNIATRDENGNFCELTAFSIKTEKTGAPAIVPISPDLQEIINASPTGDLAFIATHDGRPMTKESFGNWFKRACKAAGVPGSAHGLRKASATSAAENGATERQLEAIFAWERGGKEAGRYTRLADQVKLAARAAGKIRRSIRKMEKSE